jgi:large subunit ribosomal protein L29
VSVGGKKLQEMRDKLDSELEFELGEHKKELFDLRFKASAEGIANPSRISQLRREIARINTLLSERQQNIRGAQPRA